MIGALHEPSKGSFSRAIWKQRPAGGYVLHRIDRIYVNVLRVIHQKLRENDILWAITGSLGFVLQGVPVKPHDVDIQTDEKGAYRIESLLAQYLVERVCFSSSDKVRSHFGVLSIKGIRCEIIGDIEKRLDDGSWSPAPDLRRHILYVALEDMKIPVLSLQYEYSAYMKMGRFDRARLLRQWLRRHSSNVSNK